MRLLNKKYLTVFLFLGASLFLFSCGGLQKDIKKRAQNIPSRVDEATATLKKYRDEFDRFKKTDDYINEFHLYASPDRENWDESFVLASNELTRAKEIYSTVILPMLERNDRKEQAELGKQLGKAENALKYGAKLAMKTSLRVNELVEAKKNSKEMSERADKEYTETDSLFQALESHVRDTQGKFPNKKEDLDTRFAWFIKTRDDAKTALETVNREMASNPPDYGFLSDSCILISDNLESLTKQDELLRKKTGELERDYSKILRDMNVTRKPWVEEVKYQWDNWSDFDTTRVVYRTKKYISLDDYNRIVGRLGENGGIVSSGSNYEIWIENSDIDEHYYHKYLIVENDKEQVTDWVEVSEEMYEANEENLNMSILSKPVGYYEDEVIKAATPPGFDKVGNPRYGRWVENKATGQREWSFFEKYLFWHMILNGVGPRHNYYTYSRWDDWNRNYRGRRAYYGTGGVDFGSSGRTTGTNPKVSNSTFARSGGFKASRSSVRGAGSSVRGRGPGSGK